MQNKERLLLPFLMAIKIVMSLVAQGNLQSNVE